jgi:hypothetical protein
VFLSLPGRFLEFEPEKRGLEPGKHIYHGQMSSIQYLKRFADNSIKIAILQQMNTHASQAQANLVQLVIRNQNNAHTKIIVLHICVQHVPAIRWSWHKCVIFFNTCTSCNIVPVSNTNYKILAQTLVFALTNSLLYILYEPLHMQRLLKPRVHARTVDLQ